MAIIHGIDKLRKDLQLREASLQQLQSALEHELELEKMVEFVSLQFSDSFCPWLNLLVGEVTTHIIISMVLAVPGNAKQF